MAIIWLENSADFFRVAFISPESEQKDIRRTSQSESQSNCPLDMTAISERNTYSASASSSDVGDVRAAVHLIDKKSRICEEFGRGCRLFLRSATKKLNICPWVGMG